MISNELLNKLPEFRVFVGPLDLLSQILPFLGISQSFSHINTILQIIFKRFFEAIWLSIASPVKDASILRLKGKMAYPQFSSSFLSSSCRIIRIRMLIFLMQIRQSAVINKLGSVTSFLTTKAEFYSDIVAKGGKDIINKIRESKYIRVFPL